MKYILYIVGLLWIIGWIKEISYFHVQKDKFNLDYPDKRMKYIVPIMLFILWPYFYFYGKAQ